MTEPILGCCQRPINRDHVPRRTRSALQSHQTDPGGVLNKNEDAPEAAREQLSAALSRFPIGCRAGFVLVGGNAPDIPQGIALAERVEALLRGSWPDVFTDGTGAERFARPNVPPFGEVNIDVFFYSGREPIG